MPADTCSRRARIATGWMILLLAVPLTLAGCDNMVTPRRTPQTMGDGYSSARIPQVDLEVVRPMADEVFRQYYRVDVDASTARETWISVPLELSGEQAEQRRVREFLSGTSNRHREIAILELLGDGPDILARVRVEVQRLDTAERAAFAPERGDDRPTDTPIDRTGSAAAARQENWVSVGRNRQAEQAILDSLQERLSDL